MLILLTEDKSSHAKAVSFLERVVFLLERKYVTDVIIRMIKIIIEMKFFFNMINSDFL
jgi:hypothetical protein